MLDQIRRDIQVRLDELLAEAEKLRRALAALTSRDSTSTSSAKSTAPPASQSGATPSKPRATARKPARSRSGASASSAPATAAPVAKTSAPRQATARTTPGATKAAVLAALENSDAMTAGQIATATGLGRATISTTLSRLAKSGEVAKADRGYELREPSDGPAAETAAASSEAAES